MKPTPFVSVIIPVYNDPIRLKTCLQALEKQTYPKNAYEVIVVDNGSDESIEPIAAEFSQAKASSETSQRGPGVARNKGLSLAQGEVIAFTDSDCIPAPDWIERGVAKLQSVPDCGIVGGKIEMVFKDHGRPTAFELYDNIMHFNQRLYVEKKNFSVTANLFTYKHIVDLVGIFDGSVGMSDDKEWGQRVASFGYALMYADDVRVAHPARYSFKQLQEKTKRMARGNARLERKNRPSIFIVLNKDFLIGLVPPLVTAIRRGRQYKVGIGLQIKALLIWCVLKCVEIQERIRMIV